VWKRTFTFSPVRIFKTEYRLSWLVFRGFPQYLKVTARTISRLGKTASLQILFNSSSSIHLTIDATENETLRLSYNQHQKESECTLYTNCMRKCYLVIHRCSLHVRCTQRPNKCPFSEDVHTSCIAICFKLRDSMRDSRFPEVVLIKTEVFWAMNPISANSCGRFGRFAAYICRAI
jgi:hypothetical protein